MKTMRKGLVYYHSEKRCTISMVQLRSSTACSRSACVLAAALLPVALMVPFALLCDMVVTGMLLEFYYLLKAVICPSFLASAIVRTSV